jgi:cytochrome c-type biogenesis protein
MVETSVLVSALAGLASFASPCILPILPAFISYISGTTINEVYQNSPSSSPDKQSLAIKRSSKLTIFLNTVYFVLGFSFVFALLGVILNGIFASTGNSILIVLSSIGGIMIIVFGAYLILAIRVRWLNFEKRLMTSVPRFKTSYITSFVFGAIFAGSWTACVGPILGATLTLAATAPGAAYNSLLAYSLGLGVPFMITGAFFSQATILIRKMVKHLKYFNPIMGSMLIILGILVFTNQLNLLANFPLSQEIINLQGGI